MTLYACSSNPGKLREFALAAEISGAIDLVIQPLPQLELIRAPEEHGSSFEDNARTKAVYYSRFTLELVFADDSGLEVDALGGGPGVLSARYAGADATDQDNNKLLLQNIENSSSRTGRFVCVIALAEQGQVRKTIRGSVEGQILRAARGDDGFGYDPLFFYSPLGRPFAELTPRQKFAVSHRGNALRALFKWLSEEKLLAHSD